MSADHASARARRADLTAAGLAELRGLRLADVLASALECPQVYRPRSRA